jgi:hypothetical protein
MARPPARRTRSSSWRCRRRGARRRLLGLDGEEAAAVADQPVGDAAAAGDGAVSLDRPGAAPRELAAMERSIALQPRSASRWRSVSTASSSRRARASGSGTFGDFEAEGGGQAAGLHGFGDAAPIGALGVRLWF